MAGRLNTTGDTNVSIQEDSDEHQEVIEVQILPQVRSFSFTNGNSLNLHLCERSLKKLTN
jgi:hypothetical protein